MKGEAPLSKRCFWIFLAAVFFALNAMLALRVHDGARGGAIQATTIGLSFH
jgi:hypothetical protein